MQFHASGKVSLDHIYTQPDPRAYFRTLRELDYCIPQLAKPYFAQLIQERRLSRPGASPTVLDIGCSYGVNAALLKFDATMEELYERYSGPDEESQTRRVLLARDRDLARSRGRGNRARFVGLDVSRPALGYAHEAGFIDIAVHANLEERDLTKRQREQLGGIDLVISTGCLGYVGGQTLSQVAQANGEHRPWMAHFVLRMYPFESVAESLAELGYETVQLDGVFKQRRFASREEQSLVLDRLSAMGLDPQGMEANGWLFAQLYISRPRAKEPTAVVDLATRASIT